MKKLVVPLLLGLLAGAGWGQTAIYRCGNEYTNNVSQAKAKGCKLVEGSGVTVIHGGSAPISSSSGSSSAPRPKPATASSGSSSGPATARVDNSSQRARDADARTILQSELSKAQSKLTELKTEYNDGNPVRTALELRNPQGYPERVEKLKSDITRQQSDVSGIQRELDRLPAAPAAN